jgi:hypothetical protein
MSRKRLQQGLFRLYRARGMSARRAFNKARVDASRPADF